MIVVHHLENSRSQRILWMLEELGVDYEIRPYKRDRKTQLAPPELAEVHPLGRSPVITDGDRTVAESGAIIEYLARTHGGGRLLPDLSEPGGLACSYWLHYAEGSLMPLLLLKLVFDRLPKPPVPLILRPAAALLSAGFKSKFITPRLHQNLDFIEGHLAENEWFAGERFSAADIQMSFPLEASLDRAPGNENRPHLRSFVEKAQAREAYQRALERGGPYDYAL
ncbi:MAG: glutathione S-transferase [Xanthomonadales bacterium]|nr:glutathione S-transferase [Xanthomonadales bacterium]